jgi:hypothetical protein
MNTSKPNYPQVGTHRTLDCTWEEKWGHVKKKQPEVISDGDVFWIPSPTDITIQPSGTFPSCSPHLLQQSWLSSPSLDWVHPTRWPKLSNVPFNCYGSFGLCLSLSHWSLNLKVILLVLGKVQKSLLPILIFLICNDDFLDPFQFRNSSPKSDLYNYEQPVVFQNVELMWFMYDQCRANHVLINRAVQKEWLTCLFKESTNPIKAKNNNKQ